MKIQSAIATAALLGVLSSASALTTVAPATPVKYEAAVPDQVVAPVLLPHSHEGNTVNLAMTIDASGKPRNVRVLAGGDQSAYKHIIATVSKWQFKPARKDGVAVSSKVVLPLEVQGL
jgi:TonB family protein